MGSIERLNMNYKLESNVKDRNKVHTRNPENRSRCYIFGCLTQARKYACPYMPRRYLVFLMMFFGWLVGFAMRFNLSVALVAMTTNTTKQVVINGTARTIIVRSAEFDWDLSDQAHILSSFFYTYGLATVPCGYISAKYGGYMPFGYGNLIVGFLTFFVPLAARINMYALIALRLLQGPAQALLTTSYSAMISVWCPPNERCKVVAFVAAGYNAGIITGSSLAGIIAERHGWAMISYVFGGICFCWCLLYFWLVAPSPEMDPTISKKELEYIKKCFSANGENDRHDKAESIPWLKIFTSLPFYAICSMHTCFVWSHHALINGLPLYLKNILNYDIAESGILTTLPFVAEMVVGPLGGKITDFLVAKKYMTKTTVYKLSCGIGFAAKGIFFVLLANYSDRRIAIFGSILTYFIGGITLNVFGTNAIDIAPRLSSLLSGILVGVACVTAVCSPIVLGALTPNQTREEWNKMFYLTAGILAFGIVFYSIFGSAEKQSWASSRAAEIDPTALTLIDEVTSPDPEKV